MNQPGVIIVIIAGIAVIVFLVIRNMKDKKKVVEQMKNDYKKRKAGDEDIGVEEKI
jgi:tetrahydromethanopterin S-methyltransferase subunit E